MVIVNISQCMAGTVEMSRYDAGYQMKETGILSGYDSTAECAVTKLMFLQAKYDNPEIIREYMKRPLCGEITI